MFISKLKGDPFKAIGLAVLTFSIFLCESASASTVLKHNDNPVVRKIKCPKDYSVGTLHVITIDKAVGHELDDSQHFRVKACGEDKAITDKGLANLMSLKMLERLSLDGTLVTAAGIKSLAPLNIKFIGVPDDLVKSPADLDALKKALPGTTISVLKKSSKQMGAINDWFSKP
jgi:hypothetical protein